MPDRAPVILDAALGTYPRTAALKDGRVRSDVLTLHFAELATPNRAFAPMVRTLCYDVSEMAIATYLQARSAGVPIVLLPVIVAARFQQSALLCLDGGSIGAPSDLAGRPIGVRAYSQTTAMWLRGTLADGHGVEPASNHWLTFEDAHVAGIEDPPNATRATSGTTLLGALRAGEVDAVIVGNDVPDDADLRTVFPDPASSARGFWERYGVVPVNHMLTMRADLAAERPDLAVEIVRMCRAAAGLVEPGDPDGYPVSRAGIERAVALALRFTSAQHMLPLPLDASEVWAGTPDATWNV